MEKEPGSFLEQMGRTFNPDTMMDEDSFNEFVGLSYFKYLIVRDDAQSREKLRAFKPRQTYEQYITSHNNEEQAKLILQHSSRENIEKFNELASEFNKNLEDIIQNKDVDRIQNIILQASQLIRNR